METLTVFYELLSKTLLFRAFPDFNPIPAKDHGIFKLVNNSGQLEISIEVYENHWIVHHYYMHMHSYFLPFPPVLIVSLSAFASTPKYE